MLNYISIYWLGEQLCNFLGMLISVLVGVAYFTLAERKIIAAIQRRIGPNCIGYWGLFQPLADGIKLIIKQTIVPNKAHRFLFLFAPVYSLTLAISAWVVIPYSDGHVIVDIDLGVLYLLAISTLSVYGLIIAGWSSNSKYAFLGALRAAAQIISYDVSLGLILLTLLLFTGSGNLIEIVLVQKYLWYIFPFWPLGLIFFISCLAETNRSPFDLTEAEAELVSGYNVEYSAVGFALFFIAEYINILLISFYISILFFGGWYMYGSYSSLVFLGIKTALVGFCFIWVRATLPRYRYDQLIDLGWKCFLPLSLSSFIGLILLNLLFMSNSI